MRPFVLTIALAFLAWLPWSGVDRRQRRYWLWMLAVAALVFLTPLLFGDVSVWRMLIEPLPVGILVTLISSIILRKKKPAEGHGAAVPAVS